MEDKTLSGKRILVADDAKLNQVIVRKVLENEGAQCYIANDGVEVLELVGQDDFDLILLDVNMPNKNGIETATELGAEYARIIMPLTADISEEKKNIFADLGITDIIYKPYKIEDFIQQLSEKLLSLEE